MSTTLRLLIVDDDDEFLEILERQFGRRGFAVTARGSCPAALEAVAEQRFDAAIVDRSVTGGSDLEVVAKLKAIDSALPVIVLSGSAGPGFVDEAKRAGACEYLTKPCSLRDIEAAVQRALCSRAAQLSAGEVAR